MEFSAKNVSVGDHVMYAVPKPPQATTYAHGVVKSIKTSGMVKIDGTNESFEATKDNPVATIEVWAVDEDGNPKSKTDRVVAKPVSDLRVSKTPIEPESADRNSTLRGIMSEYNKTAPEGRKVTMTTLTKVFNRGVGAYKTNPSSVRPNVVSAEQWGYGRVRAFLKMLKNGKAPRKPFDQDLLPRDHPLSSKASEEAQEKRLYFRVVKEHPSCPVSKPYGVIGEKSGIVHGCHATQKSANDQLKSLYAATDPKSGYKPGKEDVKNLETPTQHEKRREREKKAGVAQMDSFKEGDIVKFMMENDSMFHNDMPPQGTHEHVGSVEHVMYDGYFGVPGSKFYSPASMENPAVLIRIWIDDQETEFMTGRMSDEVTKIGELDNQENSPDDIEDDTYSSYDNNEDDKKKDEAATYPIPDRVKKNAQRGLDLRKKFGRGGTDVGENTARTLAAGGTIGIEKVRHINRYFPRHAGDNLNDKTSNGWIAWLLWGGDAAWSWTNRIVRSYEAQQKRERESARDFTPEEREKLAKEGLALPDGSYPIVTIGDLKNAIQAFGRAKDKPAAKKHIIKRAKALDAQDMLPDNWMD
jgi:hypothetical protein